MWNWTRTHGHSRVLCAFLPGAGCTSCVCWGPQARDPYQNGRPSPCSLPGKQGCHHSAQALAVACAWVGNTLYATVYLCRGASDSHAPRWSRTNSHAGHGTSRRAW